MSDEIATTDGTPATATTEPTIPRHVMPPLDLPDDISERMAKLARILHNLGPGTYAIHLVKPTRAESPWHVTVVIEQKRQYDIA